jgi:hypothetical protein
MWVGALVIGLAAVACGSLSSLPTHEALARNLAVPTGLANGVLLLRGDCVFLQGGEQMLVIWPVGYARRGNQIVNGGNPVVQIGQPLVLGGGSIDADQYRSVRSTIGGSAIPPECETETYWLATEVGPPQGG